MQMELQQDFLTLEKLIAGRRTTKPEMMNGSIIDDQVFERILALADWAPSHGLTEPWRFVVYGAASKQDFCAVHANMYQAFTPAHKFDGSKHKKYQHMGDKASHILIAIMQRGNSPKIPAWEERAATACAIQNMLLGAAANGLAAYWGSGGMATHPAMKDYLELRDEDEVMGILYFGYSDAEMPATRNIPFNEKVKWYR